jgi:hypothetical protein
MLYGIKTVASYVTGTDIAGRNFAVHPDDTMLVSYPRSGNTWTRFLIANLVYSGQTVDFTSIERLIPDTTLQSHHKLKRIIRPRILKTHEYFDHRYPRIIYIVRDPRDVVLSYYDYNRRNKFIDDDVPIETFVEWFVLGKLGSSNWGTWGENVASWLYTRANCPGFLLLHYADLRANPVEQLRRVARFLGIEADAERLRTAVEMSSAHRMRELEIQQYDAWLKTQSLAARRAKRNRVRKDIPFIGEARSNAWRTILPESCVRQIEAAWGEIMVHLGYELVTVSSRRFAPLARA